MDDKREAIIRETAMDHLLIHAEIEPSVLDSKTSYDLFLMVFESLQSTIEERELAREMKDFDSFKKADEVLWRHGHALMMFALAESIGWMKDFKPVVQSAVDEDDAK